MELEEMMYSDRVQVSRNSAYDTAIANRKVFSL